MVTVENEIAFLRDQVKALEAEIIDVKHQLLVERNRNI